MTDFSKATWFDLRRQATQNRLYGDSNIIVQGQVQVTSGPGENEVTGQKIK